MTTALALPVNLAVDSIDAYVAAIAQVPRLEADEEKALAHRYRDEGDLEAARNLVVSNLRFVVHIARGYNGYGLPFSDLVQEGNIGLMKAVKRYDPDMGVRLVSFAVHWIRAEIHEYIIQNWRIVKVATTKAQRKLFFNLRKAKKRLGWLTQDEAQAVADDLGVKVETVFEMESRMEHYDVALEGNAEEGDNDPTAPIHYLKHETADPAAELEAGEWDRRQQLLLRDALDQLDERSREIVASRWLNEEKLTLHQLADRYNVSAERIRQLEKNAMDKLRSRLLVAM
ncbi:RNA polymerase sigma factor RpoH [Methylogaea oryzae]|uniref:RNA polymerase sigma factor RpoH n=1 Tax=Methylogaea oryzae TaxID=1295382 RepID=A0A8D4VQT5_9GAMM|nr:RNA polymerase sigma factor RpoH [Methylogaea oryzae]BBL72395.1 RNA polymerase sigma factor RpoH [Methylogaea oryzae]